jgi:hypothetical protein
MSSWRLIAGLASVVQNGGQAAFVSNADIAYAGGLIANPLSAVDQGIGVAEPIFVSLIGAPGLQATVGVTQVAPGQTFVVPPGSNSWVNAATGGHAFTAVFRTVATTWPATPVPGAFPPAGPTGLLDVIYAYLYQQYSDDDDLQAFIGALNAMQQDYVDTFNGLNLPIYTSPLIAGPLADWVMRGVYGYARPTTYAQRSLIIGPMNSWMPNQFLAINERYAQLPTDFVVADDDFYKRSLTWHYQKGDGKYFNVRWLKRRIMRFMVGANGSSPHIDQTNRISVSFGPNFEATIRLINYNRTVKGGAIPNRFGPNGTRAPPAHATGIEPLNSIFSVLVSFTPLPNQDQLRQAIATGVLELPFQFRFVVIVG